MIQTAPLMSHWPQAVAVGLWIGLLFVDQALCQGAGVAVAPHKCPPGQETEHSGGVSTSGGVLTIKFLTGTGTSGNNSSAVVCKPCAAGKYSAKNDDRPCQTCAAGHQPNNISTACAPCPADQVGNGERCSLCPSGTFPSTTRNNCTDINECIADKLVNGTHYCLCANCTAKNWLGKHYNPLSRCNNTYGSFVCTDCPDGYDGTGTSGCVDINECNELNDQSLADICDSHVYSTGKGDNDNNFPFNKMYINSDGYDRGYDLTEDYKEELKDRDFSLLAQQPLYLPARYCVNTPGSYVCCADFKVLNTPYGEDVKEDPVCYTGINWCTDVKSFPQGGCWSDSKHNASCTHVTNRKGRICGDCPSGYSGTGDSGCKDIAEIGENQYIHYLGLFAFIVSIFVSRRYFGRLTSTHAKKQVGHSQIVLETFESFDRNMRAPVTKQTAADSIMERFRTINLNI